MWKPLECAEMPRMACIATGRPTMRSCRRPAQSVQGCSITTSCSKAAWAISAHTTSRRGYSAALTARTL